MNDHRGLDLSVLTGFIVSVNWQATVSVIVGVLAGLYYATRLYKEWFCGELPSE